MFLSQHLKSWPAGGYTKGSLAQLYRLCLWFPPSALPLLLEHIAATSLAKLRTLIKPRLIAEWHVYIRRERWEKHGFSFTKAMQDTCLRKNSSLRHVNNIKAKWKWDICLVLISIWSAGTKESIITRNRTTTIDPGQESQDTRNLNKVGTENEM